MGIGLKEIYDFISKPTPPSAGGGMGSSNPKNDEARCAAGDEAACERVRKRKEDEDKEPKGEGTKALKK